LIFDFSLFELKNMSEVANVDIKITLTLMYLQTTDDIGSSESLVSLAKVYEAKEF
jgi:hypothetical protein